MNLIIFLSITLNIVLIFALWRYFRQSNVKLPQKNLSTNQIPRATVVPVVIDDPHAYDVATGLLKYDYFQERIAQAINHAQRTHMIFALICFEVDDYSQLIQKLEPFSFDEFQVALGQKLKSLLRASDAISKQSQQRYWVLLTYLASPETCTYIALRIKEAVQQPITFKDQTILITISMGIVLYPQDGADVQTLMHHAETSLQRAQEQGNNYYQFHDKVFQELGTREIRVVEWLRNAQQLDSLMLYYQTCTDVEKNTISTIQTLLFLDHPELGLISFAQFAKSATHCNKIIEIGDWLIDHALPQYKKWYANKADAPKLMLPFSLQQVQNAHFLENIAMRLQSAEIPTNAIILEIVEGLPPQNPILLEKASKFLAQYQMLIAFNLLNLGHSTLQQIITLPVHYLKLDKSLVRGMHKDNEQILEMIFAITASAGIRVIAEGVDNKHQVQYLRKLGCKLMQGEAFASPAPANAIKITI